MTGQLRLWPIPFVDLLAKINAEAFGPTPAWRLETWTGIRLVLE